MTRVGKKKKTKTKKITKTTKTTTTKMTKTKRTKTTETKTTTKRRRSVDQINRLRKSGRIDYKIGGFVTSYEF